MKKGFESTSDLVEISALDDDSYYSESIIENKFYNNWDYFSSNIFFPDEFMHYDNDMKTNNHMCNDFDFTDLMEIAKYQDINEVLGMIKNFNFKT